MAGNNKDVGFIFTWRIKNFSLSSQREEDYLRSSLFRVEMLENSEWELWLYPRKNNEIYLKLWRALKDNGPQKVTFNLEVIILKRNCSPLRIEKNNLVFQPGYTLVKPWAIPVDTISNEKELFLPKDTLKVQCRLWNENTKNIVKCFAVTQISMEKYQVSLPVCYNSDTIFLSTGEIVFKSASKKYPVFKINWNKLHENLDFEVHTIEPSFRIFVRCEISIEQIDSSKIILFEGDHWFEIGVANKKWTLSDIFKSVISDMKRSGDRSYKMNINMFASDASKHSFIESMYYISEVSEAKETIRASSEYLLPQQLEKIYLEEKFTDFTIKSDKKEFKIHKAIFGAVSPVFAAMFESNMAEKKDSTATIEDIDSDVLEKLIHYVYTENIVDMEWDDATKLYAASDKYQIIDLKQSCVRILRSKMDAENVIDALILADLHQDKMIMKTAKQLIGENASQIFRSEKWESFMGGYSKIACAVMHEVLIHSTEFS